MKYEVELHYHSRAVVVVEADDEHEALWLAREMDSELDEQVCRNLLEEYHHVEPIYERV